MLRVQLIGDAEIGSQVIAVTVKYVIDRCEPRVGKDRIWHPATISTFKRLRRQDFGRYGRTLVP